jgi:predicted O-methyltransferase YrrM
MAAGEEELHRLLGARWPCEEHAGFQEVWSAAIADLEEGGIDVGRGTFGGWDDGDIRLGRMAWCLARHLRPHTVVETGVARGLTTRVLLEALAHNRRGRLWSVDLPPLLADGITDETAAAVPEPLRDRWTLRRGSSRRALPALLGDLERIDLFVHDSMHTTRNVAFELAQAWPRLAPGGAVLIDDVEKNSATGRFVQTHSNTRAVICPAADEEVLIGCLLKPASPARAG